MYAPCETKPPKLVAELVGNDCVLPFDSVSVITPGVAAKELLVRKKLAPTDVTPGLNEIFKKPTVAVASAMLPPEGRKYNPAGELADHVGVPVPKLPLKLVVPPCV